jgi:hypothetical protein
LALPTGINEEFLNTVFIPLEMASLETILKLTTLVISGHPCVNVGVQRKDEISILGKKFAVCQNYELIEPLSDSLAYVVFKVLISS